MRQKVDEEMYLDPREVLAVAKVLLKDGPGWCQNEGFADSGRVCIQGAIILATAGDSKACSRAIGFANRYGLDYWYNDADGRRRYQILNRLDKAINSEI